MGSEAPAPHMLEQFLLENAGWEVLPDDEDEEDEQQQEKQASECKISKVVAIVKYIVSGFNHYVHVNEHI